MHSTDWLEFLFFAMRDSWIVVVMRFGLLSISTFCLVSFAAFGSFIKLNIFPKWLNQCLVWTKKVCYVKMSWAWTCLNVFIIGYYAALSALISSVSSSSYTPTRLDVKRPLLKRQKNIILTSSLLLRTWGQLLLFLHSSGTTSWSSIVFCNCMNRLAARWSSRVISE